MTVKINLFIYWLHPTVLLGVVVSPLWQQHQGPDIQNKGTLKPQLLHMKSAISQWKRISPGVSEISRIKQTDRPVLYLFKYPLYIIPYAFI